MQDWSRSELTGRSQTRRAMTTSALLTTAATLLTSAAVLLATLTAQSRADGLQAPSTLRKVFSWRTVDWARPPGSGDASYLPASNVPTGIEVCGDRLFVTVPRRKPGVPATLGYVSLQSQSAVTHNRGSTGTEHNMVPSSPLLTPYPDWRTNRLPSGPRAENQSARITSVFKVKQDACGRLWVMDTGQADRGGGTLDRITPPQVLVFDLATDQLLLRYYLKREDYSEDSSFPNIAVAAAPDRCSAAFAFLPDITGFSLVVFSLLDRASWRLRHSFFHMDPLLGEFDIAGASYQLRDGVCALAVSPTTVYFHALCSSTEFAVDVSVLTNRSAAGSTGWNRSFLVAGSRGPRGQSTASALDGRSGVLYMTEVLNHRVTCWNSASGQPMTPDTIGVVAADDGSSFVYPHDVKVDQGREALWFLTNTYPLLLAGRVDTSVFNHHVFRVPLADAISGTPCQQIRLQRAGNLDLPPSPGLVMQAAGPN